jgi:hypothetical protein
VKTDDDYNDHTRNEMSGAPSKLAHYTLNNSINQDSGSYLASNRLSSHENSQRRLHVVNDSDVVSTCFEASKDRAHVLNNGEINYSQLLKGSQDIVEERIGVTPMFLNTKDSVKFDEHTMVKGVILSPTGTRQTTNEAPNTFESRVRSPP